MTALASTARPTLSHTAILSRTVGSRGMAAPAGAVTTPGLIGTAEGGGDPGDRDGPDPRSEGSAPGNCLSSRFTSADMPSRGSSAGAGGFAMSASSSYSGYLTMSSNS